MSPMGRALRLVGGGPVFVMLRESEVGYQMVKDPTGQPLGPAVGDQKITFEAISYREVPVAESEEDAFDSEVWEFTILVSEETPAGSIKARNTLFVAGRDIYFVRVPSALAT